ncbi:MAG TPA: NADH-quinone oxidoreductase subunit NuoK [Elusimicrobiota bacterium]|nr:NADH-quinone oxidoreductase subunit NuoK [Elusimicrobiota bacterium]
MVTLYHYLVLSALLFGIGLYGVLTRRNALLILISIELLFNAANVNFVALNRYLYPGQPLGQAAVLFVIAVAAAEAVVGLALVLALYRTFRTLQIEKIDLLKG